jgi:hypothetical protein
MLISRVIFSRRHSPEAFFLIEVYQPGLHTFTLVDEVGYFHKHCHLGKKERPPNSPIEPSDHIGSKNYMEVEYYGSEVG